MPNPGRPNSSGDCRTAAGAERDEASSDRGTFLAWMKIELVQFAPVFPGREKNWARILAWAAASPADIVVFPELSSCGYAYADPKEIGPFSDAPSALAPLERLSVASGKLIVGGFAERADGHLYNSAYAIAPDGTTIYRKIHLWNREKLLFLPGDKPCVLEYEGRRIGIEICYDLQFPELTAYLSRQGAELVLAPTAWAQDAHGPSQCLHPHSFLAMASAYAYGICVAVANRIGTERDAFFPGQSILADPWGNVTTLGSGEEHLVADVPFGLVGDAKRPSPRNDLQTDHRMRIWPPPRNRAQQTAHGPRQRPSRPRPKG